MGLAELNQRLSDKIQQKRQFEKLGRQLEAGKTEIKKQTARQNSLRDQLERERLDVEKLEGKSIKGLFLAVLGSKVEQLDKERQELLAAQLKYDQTSHQLTQLVEERDYLRRELERLNYQEIDYQNLVKEKEQFLLSSGLPAAAELVSLTEKIANRSAENKEVVEAITAGNEVLDSFEKAIDSLKRARGWGTWDLLGGDLLSTAVKHSYIDRARGHIEQVQTGLSRFQRELADVGRNVPLQIELSGFESFADYFFDGLIFDWVVQSKIVKSLDRCLETRSRFLDILSQLNGQYHKLDLQITELSEQRERLIEQT